MFAARAALMRLCCLILCLVAGSRQMSITEFNVPSNVKLGEDVELQCQYGVNESEKVIFVKWWWTPMSNGSSDRIQLYQRIIGNAPQALQDNIDIKENDSIVIQSAKPDDSGTYECEVSNVLNEERMHKALLVFSAGSGPELNVTEVADGPDEDQEEDVLIQCEALDVVPQPDLSISVNQEEIGITEFISGPDDNGFYNITANATISMEKADGMEILCRLVFPELTANSTDENIGIYEKSMLYDPTGAALSTTEASNFTIEAEVASESLQNTSGSSSQAGSSWVLAIAALMLSLQLHSYSTFNF